MDLKDRIREERNKPFNEWTDWFLKWRQDPLGILLKTITDDLSKCKSSPKKIILDRDCYLILLKYFEFQSEARPECKTLYGIPFEVTEDNLRNYYRLEW